MTEYSSLMAVGNISSEIVSTLNQTHTLTQSLQACALTHIHTHTHITRLLQGFLVACASQIQLLLGLLVSIMNAVTKLLNVSFLITDEETRGGVNLPKMPVQMSMRSMHFFIRNTILIMTTLT